uniref:Anamorsin homolog n=1 Tax=Hyaloperonospora arabidopsidis (strain Emoy2) TaxID=559515 RepID=M4C1E3_HYAAE
MALHGNIVLITRQQGAETAVQQIKQSNPQVADVTILSVAKDSDVAQTVSSSCAEKENVFDAVVSFNDHIEQLSAELSALLPLLKANGVLELHVANVNGDHDEKKNAILMALMIGGFVDTSFVPIDGSVVYPDLVDVVCCVAKKQSLESAVMPLAKKTTAPAPLIKKWTVLADDFGQDNEDGIIDEDTLLDDTEEVLQAAKAECGEVGGAKKRACKNCTCGLKDGDDKPVMSEKDLNQLVSGCGNCFKGDAFRCGSCPFLGKPAFKPGMEKVLLNLDDADDI